MMLAFIRIGVDINNLIVLQTVLNYSYGVLKLKQRNKGLHEYVMFD